MKIYILTLEDSFDRYNITRNRLIESGFPHTNLLKHIGIHGIKQPELLYLASCKWNCSNDPSPAQKGCSFSHLDTMETFLKTNESYCMIVEDDLILPENFGAMFQDIVKCISDEAYDILFIGWEEVADKPIKLDNVMKKFIRYYPMCQHCYLISRSGAQKICSAIKQDGLSTVLDVWIANKAKNYNIISLCVNPQCYHFIIPNRSRMNRANGIAFQDNTIASTIDT